MANLVDHRFVNTCKDALKFDAAASFQLPQNHELNCEHVLCTQSEELLVVSPYTSRSHLLNLSSLSKPNQLLAKALTLLKPIRVDYATAPYIDAFNWGDAMSMLKSLCERERDFAWEEQNFYVVVFRSQVPPTTDRSHLGTLDERSHVEAMEGGGLLKYWFGTPDATGRNLATCKFQKEYFQVLDISLTLSSGVWREQYDAKQGSSGEGHRAAAMATRKLYTE